MILKVGILTAPHIEWEQHEDYFVLHNVRIGIGFHWDRKEDQRFEGQLEIAVNPDGTETAINHIDLEQYISSVIASEMSADSPMELLRAHAIIARSWVLRNLGKHGRYDVCADDHCQRYEGLARRNERAVQATQDTRGMVLLYDGQICDCRYYKCCGGRTEIWATCWEDKDVPYIQSVACDYCKKAVGNERILRLVLNNYDQETQDFYHWQIRYTADELADIIRQKTGTDYGRILRLEPLQRGPSGRICRLRIAGTKHSGETGKELVIRQTLSRTCLYSSHFNVQQQDDTFVLDGYGWGHGAGLCQIGAAVMAEEGTDYERILQHYYPGSRIGLAAETL